MDKVSLSNFVKTNEFGSMSSGALEMQTVKFMANEGIQESAQRSQGKSFLEVLRDSVDQVNTNQAQADQAIKELVAGRSKNIHETMLSIEKADSSLKLMMQVRNKILDAYKEIMRMQV